MRSTTHPSPVDDLIEAAAPRSLHLVDLENLMGNPAASAAGVRRGAAAYVQAAQVAPHDLVVVAMNCGLFKHTAHVLDPGWRLKPASGPDGADLALLEEAPVRWTVGRFDRLVIGSGDGIFAERAAAVRAAGAVVWAVSAEASLSRRLAGAVDHVQPLVDVRAAARSARPPASPTAAPRLVPASRAQRCWPDQPLSAA